MSSTWKNADDKAAAIKLRRDQERHLGATIDRLVHQTEMEPSGCGICHIWRRMTGRQQSAALVAVSESKSTGVATGSATQARLFGMKKADPHAKLQEAAAGMEKRIQELELRAQAERAEAKSQMQAGQKASAIRMLKRAKMTDKQLEANQQSMMAIEQQVDLMAQAQMQKQLANALASSSKGMKSQKKLLKNAESAIDDAQDARDMADDLGNVMSEFASNGNGDADEDDLMAELQSMVDDDPGPPASSAMVDVSMETAAEAKASEISRLEARLARYDESAAARDAVAQMPSAPMDLPSVANGKAKMTQSQIEKEMLLGVANGHA